MLINLQSLVPLAPNPIEFRLRSKKEYGSMKGSLGLLIQMTLLSKY